MRPQQRYEWIAEYLKIARLVDILNNDFVCAYIEATNAPAAYQPYGAPKCPQLSRDLQAMTKAYTLKRSRSGIEGMGGMGFPTWVWVYELR